ncbi:MAG TPA: glycosyltransferase family 2 protein [Actinomycetota bacterium]|nr:glycosyltransferase family 2 protein [Actinomycetota bacterium]
MENATPSVLVVLVVKDGAAWLARSLASLARQTHPRLGVVAVDNASTDGSADLLVSALTADRVLRVARNEGFPAAVGRALATPVAKVADYVFLMHDDTALAPDTVAQLVEAARSAPGVGVVGPKVLDWEEPRVLREVGMATDRFGYPYSPLEEGEIDQGQHDGDRDVTFVSSAAMLVSREAWSRVGPPDGRLAPAQADLDFCWRARLAGFRVLVHPPAMVLHRAAGARGERPGSNPERVRFHAERAALAAVLKNYGLLSLLWVLPVTAAVALARVAMLLASRRFAGAGQVLMAWGWNLGNLLGTIRRRARAQAVRTVPDREIVRLMVPAGTRLRRWFLQATAPLAGGVGHLEPQEEVEPAHWGHRLAGLALEHPVALGSVAAAFLFLVSFRGVLFAGPVDGGVLPVFPERPGELLSAFADGWRTTTLGAPGGASPAVVPLSLLGYLTFGDARILARLLVAAMPALAGATCYRAVLRRTRQPAPAVVAAACYALSAPVLWAASEGSLSAGAFLAAAPWLLVRVGEGFDAVSPMRPLRWGVSTGIGLALTASFFPAVWVVGALVLGVTLLAPGRWRAVPRGLALAVLGTIVGSALIFPFVLELVQAGGGAAVGAAGMARAAAVLRLSPGDAPGGYLPALFLPLAAMASFPVADDRRWAWRAALAVAAALPLAWLAAAGRLPEQVANPLAFLGLAAAAMSLLVGLGVRALLLGLTREAFGYRQVAVGALTAVVGLGLLLQSGDALRGAWAVGQQRIPPAWPVVATAVGPPFRVLWVGRPGIEAFSSPGGPPDGLVAAGSASVRYGLTGRAGNTVLEMGLPPHGPGYAALEKALLAVLDGRVRHGGALLAPFAIRFVVAGSRDLPPEASARLGEQLDLDLIQTAGGLSIYEVARPLPIAAAVGADAAEAAPSSGTLASANVVRVERTILAPEGGAWQGRIPLEGSGAVLLSTPFDARWQLTVDGVGAPAFRAFGWEQGFRATFPADLARIEYEDGWIRALEIGVLLLLWAAALWATRARASGRPAAALRGPPEPERPARQPVEAAP